MYFDARKRLKETLDAPASNQEWNRQARRVDHQQRHPLQRRFSATCDRQDHRQRRPDARGPSERKAGTDEKCAQRTALLELQLEAGVAIQGPDRDQAGHVKAQQNDEDPGDLHEAELETQDLRLPGAQNVPDRKRTDTQQYENAGKSRNEGATRQHHPPSNHGGAFPLLHLLDRDPRDQRQVGGHERQHARRHHGDQTSRKGEIRVRAQFSHSQSDRIAVWDRGRQPPP